MRKFIGFSRIEGRVPAPPSKSLMLRAVAVSSLTEGRTVTIRNPSFCADAEAALGIAEALGAAVRLGPDEVEISAGGRPVDKVLSCGESGLCLRLFSAVAALRSEEFVLEGRGTLMSRPVSMIEGPLRELGARCETRNGFAPVRVQGPLLGGRAVVDGTVSSQFLTGLIIALPRARGDSELVVPALESRAYVEITLDFLRRAGIEIGGRAPGIVRIGGGQAYQRTDYTIEGDWSGSAFLLVAGALAGEVEVTGLSTASLQADRAVLEALDRSGAEVRVTKSAVGARQGEMKAFSMDLSGSPDLFPPLAALACFLPGTTRLVGADRLRHKESDRGSALQTELGRLGADIHVEGNTMMIRGGSLRGGVVKPRQDHRIAMALAVAGLRAEGEVVIEEAQCVAKSYPGFFKDLAKIGGKVHE